MAPKYPHAKWRPLGPQTQSRMKSHDIICLHTMVGTLWGTDNYFMSNGYGGTESHFGLGYDGETIQWQDLDYTADANLDGNHRIISVETADMGTGFPKWNTKNGAEVPAWTDAQLDHLVDLVVWLCKTYDIPCVMIPDSKPGRRGIGYHRQGIQGNYPDGLVPGGEVWSSADGKVCPGDRRIAQIPTVVSRARKLLGIANPSPIPQRAKESDDLMADVQLDIQDDLTFRRNIMVEAGGGSAVAKGAWLCMGSVWGWTDFLVTAHAGDGGIIYQWRNPQGDIYRVKNNFFWPLELPQGTRMVVVEGATESRRTLPAVSVFHLPR